MRFDSTSQPGSLSLATKAVMLCLALMKTWLTRALYLRVIADSDEKTFFLQTKGLLAGDWLGDYTVVTLVKMPFYSMFLAASFLTGVPVLLAQQLVYAACCAVFIVAIRPALASWGPFRLLLLYAFLVFNPMTALGGERLLRNHLYASLGVLLVAGAAGTIIRADWHWKAAVMWPVIFTVALTAQWLTREESVWVVPFLCIHTVVASLVMWRLNPNVWRRNLAFVLVPYLVVVMAVFGVKSLNESYYGIFVTNEEQSREMNDAVGAIHRVNPAKPRNRYVVATKETRERIYAVSPSFARLQNVFEGELGRQWAEPICQITKECGENNVGWGWFTWELRQAALLNGHQDNAVEAAQFYDQISKEIDAACLDGRLSCQPLRSSTMPDWELELLPVGLRTLFQTSEFVLSFRGFNVQDLPSEGDRAVLSEYSALSLEQVDPTPPQLSVSGWAISTRSPVEISIRDVNGKPVDSTVEKVPRPDVVDFAKKAGYQLPVTPDSGFQVTTSCSRSCSLFIREAKEDAVWQKALPLDGSVRSYFQGAGVVSQGNATDPDLGALFRGDVILFLDTVSIVDDVGQLQRGLNSLKLAILKQIGRCYQVGMPITFLAASILFVTAWLQSIRYRTIPMSLLVVSLILLLMLNRLAVMVAFDVVAIPTSSQLAEYQRYVYPLLLMFVALLLLAPVGTLLRPRQI